MKSGLYINKTKLRYVPFSKKDLGAAYCEGFEIEKEDIVGIALSPRLALDDEVLYIILIDSEKNLFPMPNNVIGSTDYDRFQNEFNLNDTIKEWQKFEYEDHGRCIDKIIFPKERYWQNLFKSDWKLMLRKTYGWIVPKSFFGNLS